MRIEIYLQTAKLTKQKNKRKAAEKNTSGKI